MSADALPARWESGPLPAGMPEGVSPVTGHDWTATFRDDLAADERVERTLAFRQVCLILAIAFLLLVREMLL